MAAKSRKRSGKSTASTQQPEITDDVFAEISEPKEARKALLEGAKYCLEGSAEYILLKRTREKKRQYMEQLRQELDHLRLMARQLNDLLPVTDSAEIQKMAGIVTTKPEETIPEVESHSGELVAIETALRAIQTRLKHL